MKIREGSRRGGEARKEEIERQGKEGRRGGGRRDQESGRRKRVSRSASVSSSVFLSLNRST